ncbi:A-kinase anchor protein 12 [Trachinotus anak]|uniref:A-kinase anchor protein 12 n=1 Tax=Trachinotus anak TaxID=443729 RepID=UPI0039F1D52F
MGDAQSAQRGSSRAAAAEEEGGKVDDARAEQNTEDKPLKNNGQISEINGKADSTIAEVNGHCEDEIAAEAILSPDEDVSETAKSLKEDETPLENVEINEKESPNEVDAEPMEMIEMDAKQNDINESFRKFFSNIGLKLTVKRGSAEKAEMTTDVPDETNKEESNKPEYIEGTATETKSESAEQNIDLTTAQETCDNDSTTCPTLTDVTSEEVLENAEEKTTEAKEEVESDNVDAVTTSPINEDEKAQQDVTLEEDQQPTSPSSPEAEVVVSPIKRFFTTGIFSGLRKKKKPIEDETNEKELVEIGKKETVETAEETVDVQQDKAEISLGVEADTLETELKANKLKEEILSAAPAQTTDDGKSPPTDPVTITVSEPEIMSSQEKVQASPLKRLLSGSSLKKLSKKQKGRKSSDTKLSDSGEHFSDQLVSSNESAEYHREESPVQHSAEAAGEEDGAWASFKKLVTPKKRMKTSSLTNEETQIPGSAEETKPSEGEQISDHSTEEGKKRKDSSVSWEAVLCGSGRRRSRSRKTSDSEDETPQVENDNKKQESPIESSNEADEILAIAPKQAGSPSEVDGGLTWKSFKKLVTPKRKAKEEEETKDSIQSDREITQDDPSFSIKKLIPGRKKRKSTEKQDQISSDEADKEVVSGDEDSETPAVVPLSEFDTTETGIHIKTQAEVESHVSKEADNELQQDLLDQMDEPVLPCDSQQTEAEKVQGNEETLENEASATPASNEESEDLTELISKHQQLSDIPEEGIITETMATPGSITEEAARDDTIAEDLIEITSEAITAPEPVDITLTDETEMISAVSQLSESSKTSGNTTPVPVEYDVKHTEEFLHQVVETMSVSPKAAPLCSDEVSSERIVGSVSHQILNTVIKEEPAILEIHRRSDATAINIGLNAEELDVINELAATPQTESISELNEGVSTEMVSEVPTFELDTAEIAVDEVHEVSVLHPEESIKELESIDESEHQVESQTEVTEAVSIETSPEGEEIVADKGSLVGTNQFEKEPLEIDSQETESAVTEENKNGIMEQEVQTLTQKEDQILHNITDQVQVEDKDQPPEEVEELKQLAAVQAATLDSEECSVQLLEEEIIAVDIPATEPVTHEIKEEREPLSQDNVEAEKEDELQADAAKSEHEEEPGVLEAVQKATLDSDECSAQLLREEVISEDIPATEPVTHETKEETEPLTEDNVEGEKEDELQADAAKSEHEEEPGVLEAVQTATLDSYECSAQLLKEEVISEDIPATELGTHETKEETEPLTEDNVEGEKEDELQADAAKSEHEEEPGVLEAVQTATLDSEEGSAQLLEKEVISEDIPATETVTHKTKEETEPLTEDNVEAEKEDKLQADAAKSEHEEEPGVLEPVQTATLDSEEGSAQLLEKEVISEDIPATETVTHKTKEETEPLTEDNVEAEKEDKLQADAAKSEHEEEPGVLEPVQTATLDSEEGSAQLLEKEVISEDIPATETVTHKTKEETEPLTEDNVEAKMEDKLQADAAKSEHEGPEVLEAVQTATLDSEENRVQAEVLSEDIPTAESAADETKPAMENLTEISIEPENKELKTDTLNIDNQQVAEILQAMQVPTLDSEEGSVQSIEREVILEATPEVETITDELKEETEPLVEDSEPVDAFKTEHVGELQVLEVAQVAKLDSEEDSVQSLEKEVISEEVSPTETAELTQAPESSVEPEELPVEDAKTDIVQEPEVLPSDVKGIATEAETEVETSMPAHVVTESVEEGGAQEPEKQILSEDGPETDTKNAIASVTDETESKIMAELNQTLKIHEDLKTERTPQDVQVGQEDHIAEVVGELQALTAVHVSSVNEDARSVQVRETVFSEVTPATLVDNAAVTHEPKHGVHLSAVHASVEGEKEGELPGAEIKNAAVEHSVVTEVITCYLKDVSTAIPDVLMEKTSDIHEPLIDTVSSKLEFEETVMTTTPLMKDEVTETAEEGSVVMMMNVPSVQLEDNHRIQVQVVDVDIKSAKTIVDTVLVVGVTEDKEVIDVCHETVKEVDMLSATSETEELINKESKVIVQEVIQHVKEKLPETVPESMPVNLEQKVMKQPDAVTNMSEIAERQVFEDVTQTPDIPESLDVSIHDHKEDLEEPKAGLKRSEADVKTEEVKLSSEELDVKTISEETQITQIAQSQIVTPSNTGLVVPQNTGTISSIGNVESPSSLSLEFKLNIQFGQAKAPASPPPATERIEPLKKTDVSEVGVQAEEPKKQIAPTQSAESQKQTELTEVAVQATEITEPEPDNLDSTERAVIMNEPVLLDVGMQAMETAEPTEEIKSTECVTPNVQAMETIQTVRQTEKREVFLSPPVVSEAFEQETKAREPVKQTEEENDQDVWLDAEEDIYTQGETEVALHEVEEPPEQQTESDLEKTVPQCELEMDPNSKIEEEQSQQEMLKTAICEIESEGEDFAVALEHPETATGNITTTEWD